MVKLFVDTADMKEIDALLARSGTFQIAGVTTNPTIMRKCGVAAVGGGYVETCAHMVRKFGHLALSFEVLATEDYDDIIREALVLHKVAPKAYIKVPVVSPRGLSNSRAIYKLACEGVRVNVTAVFTWDQCRNVMGMLCKGVPSIISIFAGRIADTLRDPTVVMDMCRTYLPDDAELLWASARSSGDFRLASKHADIITMTPALIEKLHKFAGKNLDEYSRETVEMFHRDAVEAGFLI